MDDVSMGTMHCMAPPSMQACPCTTHCLIKSPNSTVLIPYAYPHLLLLPDGCVCCACVMMLQGPVSASAVSILGHADGAVGSCLLKPRVTGE